MSNRSPLPAPLSSKCLIAAEHPDFAGHFPNFPIFPAVSQVELVSLLIKKSLGVPISCIGVKRAKFKAMLRPETEVQIDISFISDSSVKWQISDQQQIYSMGTFIFRRQD